MRPKKYSDEEILELTRACLLRRGANISTQVIADELGVSQAMLFKRFGTKTKLLQSALAPPIRVQRLIQSLEVEPSTAPVLQQLTERCMLMLKFYNYMVPGWSILHSMGLKPLHIQGETPPIRARKAMTDWVLRLQKEGRIRLCSAESISLALIGAMQHRSFRRHIIVDDTMEENDSVFVRAIVETFWLGLQPQGA